MQLKIYYLHSPAESSYLLAYSRNDIRGGSGRRYDANEMLPCRPRRKDACLALPTCKRAAPEGRPRGNGPRGILAGLQNPGRTDHIQGRTGRQRRKVSGNHVSAEHVSAVAQRDWASDLQHDHVAGQARLADLQGLERLPAVQVPSHRSELAALRHGEQAVPGGQYPSPHHPAGGPAPLLGPEQHP